MTIQDVTQSFPIPARYPRQAGSSNRITDIVVHHTFIDPLPETATVAQEIARINSIHQYHISRGFLGVGYHGIAFPSGRGYITAPLSQWGANVYAENNHVLGVAVDTKLVSGVPSGKQQHAVAEILLHFWDYTNREVSIRPHLYWGGTTCPGPDWEYWVPNLANRVKEDDMGLTLEQRVAAHEQWHRETLDPVLKNYKDRIKQREEADKSLLQHIQKLQATGTGSGVSMTQVTAKVKELIGKIRLKI